MRTRIVIMTVAFGLVAASSSALDISPRVPLAAPSVTVEFGPPVPLSAPINTEYHEAGGAWTPDHSRFIFASTRPGGSGWFDLWMASWDNGWTSVVNLGPYINTQYEERNGILSADGNTLYFRSNRPGLGDFDMYQSVWTGTEWGPATLVPGPLNTAYGERSGAVVPDGMRMYLGCQRAGHPGYAKMYYSEWNGTGWGTAQVLTDLDTPYDQGHCTFGPDPDFMVVTALDYPGGYGSYDIYSTTRVGGVWQPLVNLGPYINSMTVDWEPVLSPLGDELYITTIRPGGPGGSDIWVTGLPCAPACNFAFGDLNCDGQVNTLDVVKLVRHLWHKAPMEPCCPTDGTSPSPPPAQIRSSDKTN